MHFVYPPEVLRHRAWALFGSGALALVGAGTLVAVALVNPSADVFLLGFTALALGTWMGCLTISWYQRALNVISNVEGLAAEVRLEQEASLDSISLYAAVRIAQHVDCGPYRVPLVVPKWDYLPLTTTWWQADLYVDPRTGRCVAVGSQDCMLWCLPHNQSMHARHHNP